MYTHVNRLVFGFMIAAGLGVHAEPMQMPQPGSGLSVAMPSTPSASAQLVYAGVDDDPAVWLEDDSAAFYVGFGPYDVLPGIQLASSASPSSPLFNSVLALYSKLLVAQRSAIDGWEVERLRAWLSNGRSGSNPAYGMEIEDIIKLDLDRVHVHALPRQLLLDLGIAADIVSALTPLPALAEKLEAAMMELPQGLQGMPKPVAVAIRPANQGNTGVVALLLLAP